MLNSTGLQIDKDFDRVTRNGIIAKKILTSGSNVILYKMFHSHYKYNGKS